MAGPFEPGLRPVPEAAPAVAGEPELASGPIRLVVIDPETAFTRGIARRTEALGWQGRIIPSPPAVDELAGLRPNAVVLDADCDPAGPWELIAAVTAELPETGVVVVSRESKVSDRVRGLRLGADDWLVKPVHPEELIARVQAVVRRRRAFAPVPSGGPLVAGELQIRPDRFQGYVGEENVGLTRREFELLDLLARADGRVLEREEIYLRVWGYSMVRGDRSVDVFVRKLRGKLAAASPSWRYVHTHVGVGYRFDAEPVEDG